MIKKIIEISQAKTHLSIQYGQLLIRQKTGDRKQGTEESEDIRMDSRFRGNDNVQNAHSIERSIPCEDIGVLLVDHGGVTYTHSVFTELLKCGAAVVLCGGDHHPAGMLLPIEGNTVQTERFRQQIEAKEPLKKQLWRQLVRAKIKHQARITGKDSDIYKSLMVLRERVRSGDPDNIEAQASKKFWQAYLQGLIFCETNEPAVKRRAKYEMDSRLRGNDTALKFRRNRDGVPPNNLLNYGYMVMRAAVARALCSAGLHPSIGLHHCNKYNAFCLADDVMEPFRGFVESKVKQVCETETAVDDLTQTLKAQLLEVLYQEVMIGDIAGPLMVGLHRTAASLQRCFAGEQKEIELPKV